MVNLIRNRPTRFAIALASTSVLGVLVFLLVPPRVLDFAGRNRLPRDIANWSQFDGIWEGTRGTFSDLKGGGGDKALSGSPEWGDYTLTSDIRFDSDRNARWADAGLIVRATDATLGTDAYNGYYIGLRMRDHTLLLGRVEKEYVELGTTALTAPIAIGAWYRLSVTARGCSFQVMVSQPDVGSLAQLSYKDQECLFRRGQIGLRTYNAQASWRDVQVATQR